jgi:phage tail-like protein
MLFEEVSGLNAGPMEHLHGDNPEVRVLKMPGTQKFGIVTMKRGVFKSDNQFRAWFNQIKMTTITRIPVTISLLDEHGSAVMVWRLENAWPAKITVTEMKADGNEVAVDTLEIAHEGVTIPKS